MSRPPAALLVGRWSNESADQGIFTTDERLVITSWNRWLERHSGRSATDLVGRPLFEAFPELAARGLDEHYREALCGHVYLASHLLHGHLLPMRARPREHLFDTMRQRARIEPLRGDDGIAGTITIIDDVSDRAASEQELRKQIAAQRVARAAAEDALRAKDEFLAMLGHELRNPLAPILTALQLLRLRGVEGGGRERDVIERQARHLVALVNDLLDVSRISRGKVALRKERVEIAAIVARAIETASPLLEERRHALSVSVPRCGLAVDGDPGRLAQVLANLLVNAAKYTDPGGAVAILARAAGNEVEVQVRDTGVGIDAAMLPHIFDLFFQARQTIERPQGGLGLGLALVRSFVELHGGSVTASSAGRGMGAEFTVRLPHVSAIEAPRLGGEAGTALLTAGSAPSRVLIVDDNDEGALLLAELLTVAGYITRHTHDGPSALQVAEEFAPDIALLDLGLPVMDGFELARRFGQHPQLRRTRLVALTGYGQDQHRRGAAEVGFVAHLVKPVDVRQLITVLDGVATRRPRRGRPSGDAPGGRSSSDVEQKGRTQ